MFRGPDGERPLLLLVTGLVSLPVLAGLAAGVLGALGAGAMISLAGLDSGTGGVAASPTLYMPSYTPTPTQAPQSVAPQSVAPQKTLSTSKAATTKATASPATAKITLSASPTSVAKGERIQLSGGYPKGAGAVLQVQQKKGSKWRDFPVTTTVTGRTFLTWIITSQGGDLQFRVADTKTGAASNAVTVTVH